MSLPSQGTSNLISDFNYRAPSSLSEGSTWNGTFEGCHQWNCMSILINTTDVDKIGRLFIYWSRNGTDIVKTSQMRIMDGQIQKTIYSPIKCGFVKVAFQACTVQDTRVTPVANTYSSVEIITMFHRDPLTSYEYDVTKQKYCMRTYELQTNVTKLWGSAASLLNTTYPFPSATQIRIHNSGNANGYNGALANVATTGLLEMLVIGIDSNYDECYWRLRVISGNVNLAAAGLGIALNPNSTWFGVNELILTRWGTNNISEANATLRCDILSSGSWIGIYQIPFSFASTGNHSFGVYTLPKGYTARVKKRMLCANSTSTNLVTAVMKKVQGSNAKIRDMVNIFPIINTIAGQVTEIIDSDDYTIINGGDSICVQGFIGSFVSLSLELELS